MPRNALPAVLLACACITLCGCATTYVDEAGARHVVGLVWTTLPPMDRPEGFRMRSLGVTAANGPMGSSVVVGYADGEVLDVRDNQCVGMTRQIGAGR